MLLSRGISPHTWLKWVDVAALFAYFVLFCVIYYTVVRLVRWPTAMRMAGGAPPSAHPPKAKGKAARANPHSATLSWRALEYTVPSPVGAGRKVRSR